MIGRTAFLSCVVGTMLLGHLAVVAQNASQGRREVLWYRAPAPIWDYALHVGNGRLGAMVFGGANTGGNNGDEQDGRNLMDTHPPGLFQIDGNLGAANGMLEALVQSRWLPDATEIAYLPALPAQWPEGSVEGFRVRENAVVDLR